MERLGAVERVETPPHVVMPLREARKSSWTAEKPVWRLCHNQHRLNRNITNQIETGLTPGVCEVCSAV